MCWISVLGAVQCIYLFSHPFLFNANCHVNYKSFIATECTMHKILEDSGMLKWSLDSDNFTHISFATPLLDNCFTSLIMISYELMI